MGWTRTPDFSALNSFPHAGSVIPILQASLAAADPYKAVGRSLHRSGSVLEAQGERYDLADLGRVLLLAAGKAAYPMALAAEEILGERLTKGLVVTKDGYTDPQSGGDEGLTRSKIIFAGHPVPDERSLAASGEIHALLADPSPNDLLVFLISGGASALLTSPVQGVSLQDVQVLTNALLRSGATINELNALRKHLDGLKGGGLLRLAAPARLLVLVLSDVIGDPLDVIASGPAAPDPTTYADCLAILRRYSLLEGTQAPIREVLEKGLRGQAPETLKPGDPLFERVRSQVIANNFLAAIAAHDEALRQGFNTLLLTSSLQGEAREAGKVLAAIARQIRASGQPLGSPACLLAGGETTVTVRGDGKGGRNQELALGSLEGLAGLKDVLLVTLATDGGDGPTDAAGAFVTGETYSQARAAGLDPDEFLRRSHSYHFFEQLHCLLKTGPTMTNVNDLSFLFTF